MSPAPFNLKDKKTVLVTRCGMNAPVLAEALTDAGAILSIVHPESATPPPASAAVPWFRDAEGLQPAVSSAMAGMAGIDILVNDLGCGFC